MTSCMRPSRALDNPEVLIGCSSCAVLYQIRLVMDIEAWRGQASPLHFKDGQDVAGWVFKPRDLRATASGNPLFVRHQLVFVIGLEVHATPSQLVYRLLNVVDRKIQDGEGRRNMVLLGVHQD